MTIEEKLAGLNDKLKTKQAKLNDITASIEKKRSEAKKLTDELDKIKKEISCLETEKLTNLLKSRNIGIETVIEAVSAGIFDDNNGGAVNGTENITQEEKTDEISGSGKTVGNA